MSLYRNFMNVGAMTLISRVLGFLRDILIANILGTGMAADAFFAAFRFPNLFRRLFAEGAFNAAFIPLFARALEESGEDKARKFATSIISWLTVFVVVLTVLAEIFMPLLLIPFVPGFLDDPEKFEFTVLLTRICFPYLAAMSLMAAYGGILNGLGKFLSVAFAPVLLNIVLVTVLAILTFAVKTDVQDAAVWLVLGVFLGGIAQLALVRWALARSGFLPRFQLPRLDSDVRRFWVLAVPAILTGGITQINIFVGTIIASGADSAISYLYYADRLYQLPLGIIGIAIGVVLLPELSRHLKGGRTEQARQTMDQSLLFAMILSLPATAGLITLAHPIIATLFEHGAFDAAATASTATALIAFSAGLPAFVLIKLLQPGFFAREDTRTPTYFAAVSLVINVALSLLLFAQLQHVGIAIATTVAAWSNTGLLALTLARRGHFSLTPAQLRQHGLIVLVSVVLAFLLWATSGALAPILEKEFGSPLQVVGLLALISFGAIAYFGTIHFVGVLRVGDFIKALRNPNTNT